MEPPAGTIDAPAETAARRATRPETKPRPLKRPEPSRWVLHAMVHAHWDRDGVLTSEELRPRLVAFLDRLVPMLETGTVRSFVLDGQTAPMEEYLEARPEMERRVAALAAAGKLALGPATTQPDLFLADGEALVRNLLAAKGLEKRWGALMSAGYFADCCGVPAQLPQILAGFGIGSCLFWRGHGGAEEPAEFRWIASDGRSEVIALKLDDAEGYALGHGFPPDSESARSRLAGIIASRFGHATSGHLLLPCGDDHAEPPAHLTRVLKEAAEALGARTPLKLQWGAPDAFARAVKRERSKLPERRDEEFRSGRDTAVFSGALSARAAHKRLNFEAESLLFRLAEPAALAAMRYGLPYPADRLARATRLVLANQAHASLAGAVGDDAARDVEERYRRIFEIAGPVVEESLGHLAEAARTRESAEAAMAPSPVGRTSAVRVLVFNPLPWTRSDRAFAEIEFPAALAASGVDLIDESGNAVETAVHEIERETPALRRYPALPLHEEIVDRFHVSFLARDVPAVGYLLWTASPKQAIPVAGEAQTLVLGAARPPSGNGSSRAGLRLDGHQIENEHLIVHWETDGTLTLAHKASGRVFRGLNRLVDGGDAGDVVTHAAPPVDRFVESSASRMALTGEMLSHDIAVLRATFDMPIPRSLGANRSRRATATVPCFTRVEAFLTRGSKRLDIRVTFDNEAEDHRLRALFPAGIAAEESLADAPFDVRRRPTALPIATEGWVEPPSGTHPLKNFCGVLFDGGGLLVASRGQAEYEVGTDGVLALTLLRAVGWIGRPDAPRRRGAPPARAASAQSLGRHLFQYALVPFSGDPAIAVREVLAHNHGLHTHVVSAESPVVPVAFPRTSEFRFAPSHASLLAVEPPALALSAFKLAEDGRGAIVRLFNYSRRDLSGRLTFGFDIESAERTDLAERPLEKLRASGRGVDVEAPAKTIVTLRVRWREG